MGLFSFLKKKPVVPKAPDLSEELPMPSLPEESDLAKRLGEPPVPPEVRTSAPEAVAPLPETLSDMDFAPPKESMAQLDTVTDPSNAGELPDFSDDEIATAQALEHQAKEEHMKPKPAPPDWTSHPETVEQNTESGWEEPIPETPQPDSAFAQDPTDNSIDDAQEPETILESPKGDMAEQPNESASEEMQVEPTSALDEGTEELPEPAQPIPDPEKELPEPEFTLEEAPEPASDVREPEISLSNDESNSWELPTINNMEQPTPPENNRPLPLFSENDQYVDVEQYRKALDHVAAMQASVKEGKKQLNKAVKQFDHHKEKFSEFSKNMRAIEEQMLKMDGLLR